MHQILSYQKHNYQTWDESGDTPAQPPQGLSSKCALETTDVGSQSCMGLVADGQG